MPRLVKHPTDQDKNVRRTVEAWAEYMEACRLSGDRYDDVEVWAWDRLQARLKTREKAAA